jgi:hypothetical protein
MSTVGGYTTTTTRRRGWRNAIPAVGNAVETLERAVAVVVRAVVVANNPIIRCGVAGGISWRENVHGPLVDELMSLKPRPWG